MKRQRTRHAALGLGLAVVMGLGSACADEEPGTAGNDTAPEATAEATPATTPSPDVEDVADEEFFENPDEFVGRTVVVSGNVASVINARAFLLEGTAAVGEKLLVLGTTDLSVAPDDDVTVTGSVGEFVLEDAEKTFGDLDDNLFLEYQDDRYLTATSITPTARPTPTATPTPTG